MACCRPQPVGLPLTRFEVIGSEPNEILSNPVLLARGDVNYVQHWTEASKHTMMQELPAQHCWHAPHCYEEPRVAACPNPMPSFRPTCQQPVCPSLLGRSNPAENSKYTLLMDLARQPVQAAGQQHGPSAQQAGSCNRKQQQQHGREDKKPIGQAPSTSARKGKKTSGAVQPGLVSPPTTSAVLPPAGPEAGSDAAASPMPAEAAPEVRGFAELADAETVAQSFSDGMTTVMLRNVPNRYITEELLAEVMGAGFDDTFDFFYLPIDFKTKRNRGYAFINFHAASFARQFALIFHKKALTLYPTKKVLEVSAAVTQGYVENVKQFNKKGKGRVTNQWFKPMLFSGEGSDR